MSLITEINRTNTSKEKAKKDKVNINNKLVSLGGQSATDLSKVAEKIEQMVTKNYKKFARGTCNISLNRNGSSDNMIRYVPMNLNFKPKEVYIGIDIPGGGGVGFNHTTYIFAYNQNLVLIEKNNESIAYIRNMFYDSKKVTVELYSSSNKGNITEWIAIGE